MAGELPSGDLKEGVFTHLQPRLEFLSKHRGVEGSDRAVLRRVTEL